MDPQKQLEIQIDIAIDMADPAQKTIRSELLVDPATVRSYFRACAKEITLQAGFLLKLSIEDATRLCRTDVIPEEAFSHIYFYTLYPADSMIAFLRAVGFDSRQAIFAQLRKMGYEDLENLEKRIDARYGIIEGVLFQDISQSDKMPNVFEKIRENLNKEDASLDYFKQYLVSASRNSTELQSLVGFSLDDHGYLFKNRSQPIENKADFAKMIKFSYLLTIEKSTADRYNDYVEILAEKTFKTLLQYADSAAIGSVLDQYSEAAIAKVLLLIEKCRNVREMAIRNKANLIKKEIEKLCSSFQMPKVRKSIRRYELPYALQEV